MKTARPLLYLVVGVVIASALWIHHENPPSFLPRCIGSMSACGYEPAGNDGLDLRY